MGKKLQVDSIIDVLFSWALALGSSEVKEEENENEIWFLSELVIQGEHMRVIWLERSTQVV